MLFRSVELFRTARKPAVSTALACPPLPASAPSALDSIISGAGANIEERIRAAHSLGDDLDSEEIGALYSFLKSPAGAEEKGANGLHALKNDILNVLRQQSVPAPGLADMLIGIYRDLAQDGVMRDYAIQHLTTWYDQDAADAPGTREKIRAVLHEATEEKTTIAGTALLGLHRLSAADPAFDQEKISRLALRLACSDDTLAATRITAVQICAERGLREALPTIEALAQTAGCVPLKLSAIAALGRLGGPDQTRHLRQMEDPKDETVLIAVRIALRQLEQKEALF